jgi:iron complex transport system permease protein
MTSLRMPRTSARRPFRMGTPPVSGVLRPRVIAVCVVLAVLTGSLWLTGITLGDYPIGLGEVVAALAGHGDTATLFAVYELRLPRALVGLLVGLALGGSGAVLQALTRNPLASPDLIGITAGANTTVVAGIVLGFGAGLGISGLALVGGLASALAIYLLSWRGGTTGYRLVLIGIGIAAMCTSATSYLLTKAQLFQAQQAMVWLTGSLINSGWAQVYTVASAMVLLLPAMLLGTRWLTLLQLGDETARGLGVPVQSARLVLVTVAVGLVAFATAAAGPITFVALAAPQIARRLTGLAGLPPLASALTGAVMVLASDLVAAHLLPLELPVGVLTGVIGAPYLLWLLARLNRSGQGG